MGLKRSSGSSRYFLRWTLKSVDEFIRSMGSPRVRGPDFGGGFLRRSAGSPRFRGSAGFGGGFLRRSSGSPRVPRGTGLGQGPFGGHTGIDTIPQGVGVDRVKIGLAQHNRVDLAVPYAPSQICGCHG